MTYKSIKSKTPPESPVPFKVCIYARDSSYLNCIVYN